ncbi:hypothetical protein S40288_01046 [Stachybotrys chartarum IBT 40288]|nr:hypothetical protein S40288_01046 [Stachybotrys chartarum IBT 40288]
MEISTSIAIQAVFLSLALLVTLLRVWVRLRIEHRDLTPPDYLVWGGWAFALGWSLENQLDSIWNSIEDFVVNWVLNITTDILLFCLPFFVLNCLKLHRRQKIGLAGVFSLGMITMITSTARFATYIATDYDLDDAAGNAWCTIEMCTAVIVVSLPGLKSLIVRKERQSTKERSSNGYIPTSSNHLSGNRVFGSQAHAERLAYDDEMELVAYNNHADLSGMMSKADLEEITKDIVVTTNFTITRSPSQNNDELASEHNGHR